MDAPTRKRRPELDPSEATEIFELSTDAEVPAKRKKQDGVDQRQLNNELVLRESV